MRLSAFTIVLDGEPWIRHHLEVLQKTNLEWNWVIVEGVARPTKDTSWVKGIEPRLSLDGTHEYLKSINDKRVKVISRPRWENKTSMCNEAVQYLPSGVLMQIDSDELWKSDQFETIVNWFEQDRSIQRMRFFCRYYVGPSIITTGFDSYGNNPGEWLRAWRYSHGQRFITHEPPVLGRQVGYGIGRELTAARGLVFDHMAYASEKQVAFKEEYYGYEGAVRQWRRLQANKIWPVKLKDFLPWVDDNATANQYQR